MPPRSLNEVAGASSATSHYQLSWMDTTPKVSTVSDGAMDTPVCSERPEGCAHPLCTRWLRARRAKGDRQST